MKCSVCGAQLGPGARYCGACGGLVQGSEQGVGPAPSSSNPVRPPRRSGRWTLLVVVAVVVVVLLLAGISAVLLLRHQGPSSSQSKLEVASKQTSSPPQSASSVQPEPRTIGKSVQGRAIEVISFGSGPRRLLVVGGVHGNEYGSDVAEQLIAFLKANPDALPEGVSLDVVPCLNPDGLAADTRANAHAVDLNRNFPTKDWCSKLSEKDYSGQLHLTGGAAPASEPETKALLNLMRGKYIALISLHSQGGILDFSGPQGEAMARHMSRLSGLKIDHVAYQSFITGSMGTYIPAKYHIPIITVELKSTTLSTGLRKAILTAADSLAS